MPLNGERAFEIMQREGVDTLIASSTENVFYVSNYWSLGKNLGCGVQAYAVLPIKGVPAVVAPLDEADLILNSQTWIEDIRFYGKSKVEFGQPEEPSDETKHLLNLYMSANPDPDGIVALIKTLEEKKLSEGVIALDTTGVTPSLYDQIKSKLSEAKIVNGTNILSEIRLVKTESEIERIKRATAITEKSMEDALEIARSEITELDMASMYAYSVAYDGGQVTQNLIGFRDRSAFPNPTPSFFESQSRDLVRMTFGCTWDHYHSNISRTAVIGRPLQKVQRRWEAVTNAQDAALDAIKPGVKVSDICDATSKALEASGLKDFSSGVGHGLGVECNERPWILLDAKEELLEGMVLNVDIPLLELGWGGTQLEDTILVTSDGFELLTRTDRTLYLL